MAGGAQDDGDDGITGINVTPLVDVVLVLLIIFMVTATYIVRESIEVELPRAAHGGESVGVMLNIVITKDARAIISADKNSFHGAVVHVIDLIKGQGIGKFAINIEKDQTAPN